eukprot:gene8345-22579_t
MGARQPPEARPSGPARVAGALPPPPARSRGGEYPLAWNNPRNASVWAGMEAELEWPAALSDPRIRGGESHFGIFMGPQGSGTSMHYHKAAWNALVYGRKLWALTPPAESAFRRRELAAASFRDGWLDEAAAAARGETGGAGRAPPAPAHLIPHTPRAVGAPRRLYCVQREDDVVFVPHGWGHATLNLREGVGAAGYRPNKVWHATRGIRSVQTAAGISSPSDIDPDGHP